MPSSPNPASVDPSQLPPDLLHRHPQHEVAVRLADEPSAPSTSTAPSNSYAPAVAGDGTTTPVHSPGSSQSPNQTFQLATEYLQAGNDTDRAFQTAHPDLAIDDYEPAHEYTTATPLPETHVEITPEQNTFPGTTHSSAMPADSAPAHQSRVAESLQKPLPQNLTQQSQPDADLGDSTHAGEFTDTVSVTGRAEGNGDDEDTEPTLAPAKVEIVGGLGTLSLQVVPPKTLGHYASENPTQGRSKVRRRHRRQESLTPAERQRRLSPEAYTHAETTPFATTAETATPVAQDDSTHSTQAGSWESTLVTSTSTQPAVGQPGEGSAVAGLAQTTSAQAVQLTRNHDSESLASSRKHVAALAAGVDTNPAASTLSASNNKSSGNHNKHTRRQGRRDRSVAKPDALRARHRQPVSVEHHAGQSNNREVPAVTFYACAFVLALGLTALSIWPHSALSPLATSAILAMVGAYLTHRGTAIYQREGSEGLGRATGQLISRFGPVTLTALAIATLITWWRPGPQPIAEQARDMAAASLGLTNLWLLAETPPAFLTPSRSAVEHFWLPNLVWQSAACGLLMILNTKPGRGPSRKLLWALGLSVVAFATAAAASDHLWPSVSLYSPMTRFVSFFCGALVAAVFMHKRLGLGARAALCLSTVAAGAGWAAALHLTSSRWLVSMTSTLTITGILAAVTQIFPVGQNVRSSKNSAPSWDLTTSESVLFGYSTFVLLWPVTLSMSKATGDRSWASLALAAVAVATLLTTAYLVRTSVLRNGRKKPLRNIRFQLAGSAIATLAMAIAFAVFPQLPVSNAVNERRPSAAGVSGQNNRSGGAECFGANAMSHRHCRDIVHQRPNLSATSRLTPKAKCVPHGNSAIARAEMCSFGSGPLLVWWGDDELTQWEPALKIIAAERKWQTLRISSDLCTKQPTSAKCADWTKHAVDLINGAKPSRVVMAASTNSTTSQSAATAKTSQVATDPAAPAHANAVLAAALPQLDTATPVTTIASMPRQPLESRALQQCLLASQDPKTCSMARAQALTPDVLAQATSARPGSTLINPTTYVCDDKRCYSAIGGLAVYNLASRVNSAFAQSATELLKQQLEDH